jgi:hypothetical protein
MSRNLLPSTDLDNPPSWQQNGHEASSCLFLPSYIKKQKLGVMSNFEVNCKSDPHVNIQTTLW